MARGPTKSYALIILFPGFDTLDVNGPMEALRQAVFGEDKKHLFEVTVAAEDRITVSDAGTRMERNIALDQNLIDDIAKYDLIIVPGGPKEAVEVAVNKKSLFNKLIKTYSELEPRSDHLESILFSVCTGALFLGRQGVFNDAKYCTTHWAFYSQLKTLTEQAANEVSTMDINGHGVQITPGVVIPARFVDAGTNKKQIRLISSGGVSCGIDAALHVIRLRADSIAGTGGGELVAANAAKIMDYSWRVTEGVVFDPI